MDGGTCVMCKNNDHCRSWLWVSRVDLKVDIEDCHHIPIILKIYVYLQTSQFSFTLASLIVCGVGKENNRSSMTELKDETSLANSVTHQAPFSLVACFVFVLFSVFLFSGGRTPCMKLMTTYRLWGLMGSTVPSIFVSWKFLF